MPVVGQVNRPHVALVRKYWRTEFAFLCHALQAFPQIQGFAISHVKQLVHLEPFHGMGGAR